MDRNEFGVYSEGFFFRSLLYKYLWTFSFVVQIPVETAIMRLTADFDLRKRLPKAIVYLAVWHFALKFVLLLFVKIHDSPGRRDQDFSCALVRRGKKAPRKLNISLFVCMSITL